MTVKTVTGRRDGTKKTSVLLGIAEVAKLLDVHPATLYRAIQRNELPLPVIYIGRRMRVPRAAVDRLIGADVVGVEPRACVPGERTGHPSPSRSAPTCTAARRSSASMASV
jgi:excisionase family DNA binding protein